MLTVLDQPQTSQTTNPQTLTPTVSLEALLKEPGTVLKIHKVGATSYRVNWFKAVPTGLGGLNQMVIHKTAFLFWDGKDITYPAKQ